MRPNTSSALGYGHIPEGSKAATTTGVGPQGPPARVTSGQLV